MKQMILAIDDDEPMLWLITKVLNNFDVVSKSDGLEAMIWLSRGNHPDLIILDREMPNLKGESFLRGLRGSGIHRDIPVIVVSGRIDENVTNDLSELDVKKFIEKPFNPAQLKEQVESCLYSESLSTSNQYGS